jgi:mono/diheme cytochrome c family protein
MNRMVMTLAALAVSLAAAPTATTPASALYQRHCAACHGVAARGDGPWADLLAFRPADLTRIAARSRGEFPVARVRAIIDGRKPVKGHFPGGMPVWGESLKNVEDGYSEEAVRQKISALAEYLRTVQAPAEDRRAGPAR